MYTTVIILIATCGNLRCKSQDHTKRHSHGLILGGIRSFEPANLSVTSPDEFVRFSHSHSPKFSARIKKADVACDGDVRDVGMLGFLFKSY